ncbi:hypothetical protein D9M69_627390 [compost metagenome]
MPVAEKSQSGAMSACMASKPVRLAAASASSCAVVSREVAALHAARKARPQRHCSGSSCGRSFSGEVGENSSLGSCVQIDGSASGCTYE